MLLRIFLLVMVFDRPWPLLIVGDINSSGASGNDTSSQYVQKNIQPAMGRNNLQTDIRKRGQKKRDDGMSTAASVAESKSAEKQAESD